jgi:succinoglycan biosynthesis protein ExoA
MPSVSIIIPCYNEESTITDLLIAIYKQTFPRADLEVVIADGMSTDQTRSKIAEFADSHADLHIALVDNPKRIIPAALNEALKESQGEIIVRMDAHSIPHPEYVERSVADLQAGLGTNVGGVWEIQPGTKTWMARAISTAAAHPLGVGDALYRHAVKAASVDTVPFGAFHREVLATIGFFDETLLTNEDYEFNARIRKSGGVIWLDPAIKSIYISRSSLSELAKQYWRYGFWKWQMLRRYPDTLRWRQGLPPLFVMSLLAGMILSIFYGLFRILLFSVIIIYLLILVLAGFRSAILKKDAGLIFGLPLAISTMHISWGMGFLWSMIRTKPEKSARRSKSK